jgi:predicted nucleotidyltransferase
MEKIIDRIKNYIIHVTKPTKVILFGSVAQEKNNVYSDIDILVVTKCKVLNNEHLAKQIQAFIKEFSFESDIYIIDEDSFMDAQKDPFSFINITRKTGKIIYKKTA